MFTKKKVLSVTEKTKEALSLFTTAQEQLKDIVKEITTENEIRGVQVEELQREIQTANLLKEQNERIIGKIEKILS